MGIISKQYIKNLVHRYDKEAGIPYYSCADFNGLKQDAFTFVNSRGVEIHCFYYYYDKFNQDKIILFCPGIGPGHTAYLTEIEELAKRGYKVLTLDYTGCGESKGEILGSLNMPTVDVMELLDYINLKKEIVLIGHSLGAYTSLNVVNLRKDINKAVIISGFLSPKALLAHNIRSKFLLSRVLKYEEKTVPEYYSLNNIEYLKTTKDKLFFIHSEDDQIVPYNSSLAVVLSINNPSIKTLTLQNRKHNPNYTDEAVKYMNDVFADYQDKLNKKEIVSDEDKINYFKNISIKDLTTQDENIFDQIEAFLN